MPVSGRLAPMNGFDFTWAAADDHDRPSGRWRRLLKELIMLEQIKTFLKDEEGASAVEYGLIIGLIAVFLILVLTALGGGLGGLFNRASVAVNGVP